MKQAPSELAKKKITKKRKSQHETADFLFSKAAKNDEDESHPIVIMVKNCDKRNEDGVDEVPDNYEERWMKKAVQRGRLKEDIKQNKYKKHITSLSRS